MILESMVVSRDWQEVSVLECILASLNIGMSVESEFESAQRRFACSKVDALIVDYDLEGAGKLLSTLPQANRGTVPLMVMGARSQRARLSKSRADFVFEKPISAEQAVYTLSAARNQILQGRLRYHRQALELPILITNGKHQIEAYVINMSQGGVGVLLSRPTRLVNPVGLNFSLPGEPGIVEAMGKVVWQDGEGNAGIHFRQIANSAHRNLKLWLAKRYFTN